MIIKSIYTFENLEDAGKNSYAGIKGYFQEIYPGEYLLAENVTVRTDPDDETLVTSIEKRSNKSVHVMPVKLKITSKKDYEWLSVEKLEHLV